MVTKEKDEELALFLEMRRRENDKTNFLLQPPASAAPCRNNDNNNNNNNNNNRVIVSSVPVRKTAADKFLDSENEKSDYDWLLTPPGTPLFPSWEMESLKNVSSQNGISSTCVTALKTRFANIQEEPASRTSVASQRTTMTSQPKPLGTRNRRPSSSEGPTSVTRPPTPTARPTLPSTAKPSRASTPTSRAVLPSSKSTGPSARSSTPTRSFPRSATPTARSSVPVKSTSRSATPTHRMTTTSSAPSVAGPPGGRLSSATKSVSASSKNKAPLRGCSPTVKSRPWKPNEMPGFSLDAPPNLKTSLPERPASASRGRPGGAGARSSSVEPGSKVKIRHQSCSPARGRTSNGSNGNGNRISVPTRNRALATGSDDVNPVLMGTKMVERVVNMRKLAPPKQDDHHSLHNNSGGKSSSLDSSGFGRTLSKKSLDMALRHMDIRRSISGNLRPLTSIPASSVYSVRSGGSTKSKTTSVLDSPLATSSNASSEPSVNNNSFFSEAELNDIGCERGNCSPTSQSGK